MTRPPDWPRYLVTRRLRSGATGYYWTPRAADIAAGFSLHAESLGPDLAAAIARAGELNGHLDAWRAGRAAAKPDLDLQPAFGTLDWLVARYMLSPAWDRVSARCRPDYRYALDLILDMETRGGGRIGTAPLASISARAVDKIYGRLRIGPRGPRTRIATVAIQRLTRAWDVVRRLYPRAVPADNPWRGVTLVHGQGTTRAATRAEAYALHRAIAAGGHPHLAAAPLICFEWLVRPENVLAGQFTWSAWRPGGRPVLEISHGKTGAEGIVKLDDDGRALFPEAAAYLDALPRLGASVVLLRDRGGQARPYLPRHARAVVRKAAAAAGLPAWLTLAACRHGGMTETGDAGLTEQETMALSLHRTPDASRLYVKRTEAQRLTAAIKRRNHVEGGMG